ncbi:MAG TPA: hypothetical protein V6D02_17105 [Candidatus Obscuribacterales bacterium]
MDRTLLLLFVLSALLIAVLAPHATFTLTTIVALAVLTTRLFWAIMQSFETPGRPRGAVD